jgi:hypothetical protein
MFKFVQKPIVREPVIAKSGAQLTTLLALLLVAAGVLAAFAFMRLQSLHDSASAAQNDLSVCQQDLAELARWQSSRTTGAPVNSNDPALNRRLSAAAVSAGISGELASIEPGQPNRVRDTDYTETPVYVRLNAVTLRQVVTFLMDLSAHDAAVRAKTIELSAPQAQPPSQAAGERWTTDIGLAYQTYAPRGQENR